MNRYLFLDIDGVLNSERTVFAYQKLVHANLVKFRIDSSLPLATMFDPISVGLLKYAQEKIGFKIVISSTWRYRLSSDDFNRIFADYGWDTSGIIVGKTDDDPVIRGKQIKSWIDLHAQHPYQYCILDDSDDMLVEQDECFVQTDLQNGIDFEAFKAIFRVFGMQYMETEIIAYE